MNHKNSIIWKRAALLVGVLALTAGELMAQGASPWLQAIDVLQDAFTGPIARGLSLIAVVVGGLMFAFGEGGSKKALAGIIFGWPTRGSSSFRQNKNYRSVRSTTSPSGHPAQTAAEPSASPLRSLPTVELSLPACPWPADAWPPQLSRQTAPLASRRLSFGLLLSALHVLGPAALVLLLWSVGFSSSLVKGKHIRPFQSGGHTQ